MAEATSATASGPLTVKDVAAFLDVHPTHVTLLLRRGSLVGSKWGSTWMVDPRSAKQYMNRWRRPSMGRPRAAESRGKPAC